MGGAHQEVELLLIGIDHRSAPEALRDRLFQEEPNVAAGLSALKDAGLETVALIATCERLEVLTGSRQENREAIARAWLETQAGGGPGLLDAACYRLEGEAALLHLWRVAASLKSAMPGEPQILGQVREAARLAREAGLLAPPLGEAFQSAFAAAKRVRSETALGQRAVTMTSAALQVGRDLHGDLASCRLLLMGLGEGVELFLGPFQAAGLQQIMLCHPNDGRAETAAGRLDVHARRWSEREQALTEAEIVITGVASPHYSLERAALESVVKARRHRPMLIIDGGIPGDVNPAAGELEDIFLYDLDDLESLALAGQSRRRLALEEAETILEQELGRWRNRRAGRETAALLREAEQGLAALQAEITEEGDRPAAAGRLRQRLLERLARGLRGLDDQPLGERRAMERLLREIFTGEGEGKEKKR